MKQFIKIIFITLFLLLLGMIFFNCPAKTPYDSSSSSDTSQSEEEQSAETDNSN